MAFLETNKGNPTGVSSGGVGWIIIPQGADRNRYVANCYRTSTVSMEGGVGYSAIHNVKITLNALERIHFPAAEGERGTAVVWVRENFYNQPIIIGVLNSTGDSYTATEFQQRITQQTIEQLVEIFLDAVNSDLIISSQGTKSVPANIRIKVSGGNTENEIALESDARTTIGSKELEVTLTDNFKITLTDGVDDFITIKGNKEQFTIKDHWENSAEFTEGNLRLRTERFDVGEGNEQMVLGNTLVKLLEDLINAIKAITVPTPVGNSGTPINFAQFDAIKGRLNDILSTLSNTD